ncbi:hypothetical protein JKP88DRAFT_273142 [Tribonema minus]|uniref:Fibronectin type-III domain-containing protein n=1 Tax=Tribonema minus TaxID=303371 RepID=A0A836CE70_9STRA|nr:hypothetical protein JKP88DRAFT_273142 [Tribonema minus]
MPSIESLVEPPPMPSASENLPLSRRTIRDVIAALEAAFEEEHDAWLHVARDCFERRGRGTLRAIYPDLDAALTQQLVTCHYEADDGLEYCPDDDFVVLVGITLGHGCDGEGDATASRTAVLRGTKDFAAQGDPTACDALLPRHPAPDLVFNSGGREAPAGYCDEECLRRDEARHGAVCEEARALASEWHASLTVDAATGQVDFALGNPSSSAAETFPLLGAPTFSTIPSTGITSATKNRDAVQKLNEWLSTYLLDAPPPPTLASAPVCDTEKITITLTLPPQKKLAFTASIVPYFSALKADVVGTTENAAQDWTHYTKQTLQLEAPVANAALTVSELRLHVDQGTYSVSAGIAKAYGFTSEKSYDIRVYGLNQSSQATKYVYAMGAKTLPVGPPAAPINLLVSGPTTSSLFASWAAPPDRDVNTAGTQATAPYIKQYQVAYTATSSVRYGGAISSSGTATTTATTTSDSAPNKTVSSLNSGTTYAINVKAINTVNTGFGDPTADSTGTTSLPTSSTPSFMSTSDASGLANVTNLRGGYDSAGGYLLDSSTRASTIINHNSMGSYDLITATAPTRRTNADVGGSAVGQIGTLTAFGGPTALYTSDSADFAVQGFDYPGGATADTTVSGANVQLVVSGDGDAFTTTADKGFYKRITAAVRPLNYATQYTPATTSYSLALRYVSTGTGGATYTSAITSFFVDDLSAAAVASDLAIIGETANAVAQISGVPTFTSSAVFRVQFNAKDLANRFLPSDKKHADVIMTTSDGSIQLTPTQTVLASSMASGTNKYYTVPGDRTSTSLTPYNTNGKFLVAQTASQEVQLNDISVAFSNASARFDEDLRVKVKPYNLKGAGSQISSRYMDPSTGTTKCLRIDTTTAVQNASGKAATSTGQHVTSGTGAYPASGTFGAAYDHAQSLLSNQELQQIKALWVTPASTAVVGYKDYSAFYSSGGLTGPNYASITSSSSYRYVTFKYTGTIGSTLERNMFQAAVSATGLTMDGTTGTANHTLQVRVDNGTYSTGWLDAVANILPVGLGAAGDGTACGNTGSTASSRRFYVMTGTNSTAVVYLRLGIPCNLNATVTSITLTAVTAFT